MGTCKGVDRVSKRSGIANDGERRRRIGEVDAVSGDAGAGVGGGRPAAAQLAQEFEEEDVEGGGVAPEVGISNKGNNVNLCPTVLQSAQSGNVQNVQGTNQYQVGVDDIEFEGSNITFETESAGECVQTIEQAAAAAAPPKAAPPPPPAPKAEAKADKAEAKAKELPKTGGVAGVASLVGLGAGALLVASGLLVRRIIR